MKRIQDLIEGYRQFKKENYTASSSDFEALVRLGQKPKVLMIACCDSRVDPAIIMNCKPGDLFVIRNVANLVPPCELDDTMYHGTSAALEFGITGLGIQHIVILGHAQCGGIRALVDDQNQIRTGQGFISKWMALAKPAYDQVMTMQGSETLSVDEQSHLCSQYALMHSYQNLLTFPWIQSRVQAGDLFLHAWYFDLGSGHLLKLDPSTQEIRPLI